MNCKDCIYYGHVSGVYYWCNKNVSPMSADGCKYYEEKPDGILYDTGNNI